MVDIVFVTFSSVVVSCKQQIALSLFLDVHKKSMSLPSSSEPLLGSQIMLEEDGFVEDDDDGKGVTSIYFNGFSIEVFANNPNRRMKYPATIL